MLAAFALLLLSAAYLGLTNPKIPQYGQSDKGLHFITFFLITVRPPTPPDRLYNANTKSSPDATSYTLRSFRDATATRC